MVKATYQKVVKKQALNPRPPDYESDRPIMVNAYICWVRWQSRSTDHGNSRKIIVICFEFGSGMRGSHPSEEEVLECALMRVCV